MVELFGDATFKDGWMYLQELANKAKINLIIEPDETEDQYDDFKSYKEGFLDRPLDHEFPVWNARVDNHSYFTCDDFDAASLQLENLIQAADFFRDIQKSADTLFD